MIQLLLLKLPLAVAQAGLPSSDQPSASQDLPSTLAKRFLLNLITWEFFQIHSLSARSKTESVQFLQSPHVDSFQYSHRRSDTEKCRDFYWKWTSVALAVSSQWWYSRNPNCKCGDFLTQVWCYVHSSCLCIVNVNLVSLISSSSFSFIVSFGELLKDFCLMRLCLQNCSMEELKKSLYITSLIIFVNLYIFVLWFSL